jgi:mono/diheme cytochrome c family protein
MTNGRAYLVLAAFAAGIVLGPGAALAAASADNGKVAFVKHGCWQCHGFEGQGSTDTSAGRVLYDTKLPFEAFKAYVRDPSGAMPPFHAEILSDSDLADIYAYLQSLPKPKPASEIPLLNQ